MNFKYSEKSFALVYRKSLIDLSSNYDFLSSPRGLKIKENLNVSLTFDPLYFLFENDIRSSKLDYINGELEWYFSGRNDVDFISAYSSFWNKICNEDGTCNSAYGKLIFNNKNKFGFSQYTWAIKQILLDSDSRKSIMFFNNKDFQYDGNKDFVCTNYLIFFVRDNKLYMNVHMRSNDVVLGLPNDVAFFSMLFQQFYRHIRDRFEHLEIGAYTHIVDSFHLYENKFDVVNSMLNHDFIPKRYELMYDIVDNSGNFLKIEKYE